MIDVCVGKAGSLDEAGWARTTVDPHESQLGGTGTPSRGGSLAGPDGKVHRVLHDPPRRDGWRLPCELSPVLILQTTTDQDVHNLLPLSPLFIDTQWWTKQARSF